MKLNPELTISQPIYTPKLSATHKGQGLYNSEQFVLRLSPENHRILDKLVDDDFEFSDINDEIFQSYSTYLHETIHWWQHVGSTTGFTLSMCYPLQTHSNLNSIRDWCYHGLAKKSIKTDSYQGELLGKTHLDIRQALSNTIINNTMDFEFFRQWIWTPDNALEIYKNNYFESQGHCFHVVYNNLFGIISQLIDPNLNFTPNTDTWVTKFRELTSQKTPGYFYTSPITRKRVGILEIFEGQSCFSQMQFIAYLRKPFDHLNDFRDDGLLHGIYEIAFKEYINLTGLKYPESIKDPIVSLYLLICDISINPTEGFPCNIDNFENFVYTADPGIRFEMLCRSVASIGKEITNEIKEHSKQEYLKVSTLLCERCGLQHPSKGWDTVRGWLHKSPELSSLMGEYVNFNFSKHDVLIRVLFSHFIAFTIDKQEHPEFFCWPGYWKTNGGQLEHINSLWLRHLSLFSDKENDNGIFIRKFPDKDPAALKNTLNGFFQYNLLYDLSRQWVLQDGEFKFDFRWLSETVNKKFYKEWAEVNFENLYGVSLSKIVC